MRELMRTNRDLAELIIETVVCLIFGLVVTVLGLRGILQGEHLVYALIVWALLAPSPSKWILRIGEYVFFRKNGSGQASQPQQGGHSPSE